MTAGVTHKPKVRDDLVFRQLDDEWVVYDPAGEQLHVMNGSAAVVWLHCTGDFTVPEIIEEVARAYEYKVPRDRLDVDVAAAIRQFSEKALLA